jgi:hypothetical protein
MEQLEQFAQWISANQQTTLIAGIACVFGSIIFLFWAGREFASWFFRTGQILDEVETLKSDIQSLKETLQQALNTNVTATATVAPTNKIQTPDFNPPIAHPTAKISQVPTARLQAIMEKNHDARVVTPDAGPSLRSEAQPRKSLFPIRPS